MELQTGHRRLFALSDNIYIIIDDVLLIAFHSFVRMELQIPIISHPILV